MIALFALTSAVFALWLTLILRLGVQALRSRSNRSARQTSGPRYGGIPLGLLTLVLVVLVACYMMLLSRG